ncbi:MAG: terminase gpA endonuclease subunit, partial [Pirellulales bacterium]
MQLTLETYHRPAFPLEWSDDHLRVLAKAQLVVLIGALFAIAMPRGAGKTTICRKTVEWAVLNGHRFFPVLIGATDDKGDESLESILLDLEANPLLLEDFPEVCYPLLKLEGVHNRAKGQLLNGASTRIAFRRRTLVLPTVAGSRASGAVIKTGGLLSAIRGAQHRLPDGTIIRPDLVLTDDPQTRESAESTTQSATRERIMSADILGLAGPGKSISVLMPCTVIAPGDMADNLLNRELHPEWRGERLKMLLAFPANMELWESYWEIFTAALRARDDSEAVPAEATAYLREHHEAMHKGGIVSWEARKRPDELSALQHAMNLYLRDPAAFASEYQNEPVLNTADDQFLTADEIAIKINNHIRGQVPQDVTWLTAFIDVHKRGLYWTVCGWAPDFTGYLIDYGVWPKQNRPTFSASRLRPTLMEIYPRHGADAAIYAGLQHLSDELLGRNWIRDDRTQLQISKLQIDTGWDDGAIKRFCRDSKYKALTLPSFGRTINESQIPITQYRKRPG